MPLRRGAAHQRRLRAGAHKGIGVIGQAAHAAFLDQRTHVLNGKGHIFDDLMARNIGNLEDEDLQKKVTEVIDTFKKELELTV